MDQEPRVGRSVKGDRADDTERLEEAWAGARQCHRSAGREVGESRTGTRSRGLTPRKQRQQSDAHQLVKG